MNQRKAKQLRKEFFNSGKSQKDIKTRPVKKVRFVDGKQEEYEDEVIENITNNFRRFKKVATTTTG